MEEKNEKMKEPTRLKNFRIIGYCLFAVSIIYLITSLTNWLSLYNFFVDGGYVIFVVSFIVSIVLIIKGFSAHISRRRAETKAYIQQQSKPYQKQVATTSAQIKEDAIETTVGAIRKGIKGEKEKTIYCPNCGDKIENDENFCNKCGTKLTKICSKCQTENSTESSFCKKCGEKL